MTARVYRAEDEFAALVVRKFGDLTTHVVAWALGDRSEQRKADVRAYLRDIERMICDDAPDCRTTHHTGCSCHEGER